MPVIDVPLVFEAAGHHNECKVDIPAEFITLDGGHIKIHRNGDINMDKGRDSEVEIKFTVKGRNNENVTLADSSFFTVRPRSDSNGQLNEVGANDDDLRAPDNLDNVRKNRFRVRWKSYLPSSVDSQRYYRIKIKFAGQDGDCDPMIRNTGAQ
jgi:hypothetical protein